MPGVGKLMASRSLNPSYPLNRLATAEDALVPVLWFYEASIALAREQNRGTLAAPKADEFIAELKALRIMADADSAAQVFNGVHRLALDHRLTSYDAASLGLALRHGLPLATLDDDLIRASKAAEVKCFSPRGCVSAPDCKRPITAAMENHALAD
jgi:predicted nucleic acid-binding protein